jgi:cobalt-zinc-cadmium efflux system protein
MENHAHEHGHSHDHGIAARDASSNRRFALAVALNLAFVGIEVAAGLHADSLALLADAGHNLSDVLALLMAWGAAALARLGPTKRHTFGYRSSTILSALANAALLAAACGAITLEAVNRLIDPAEIRAPIVIAVAAAGVVLNAATAWLFFGGRKHDLNLRGAFLHMAADALVSLAVVAAGLVMLWTGAAWIDPAASLVVVAVIVVGTWRLARESLDLALHAVPPCIDAESVRRFLASRPGIAEVHDLHIWAMSTVDSALTAHLVMPGGAPGDGFLTELCAELERKFRIGHATLQIETGDPAYPCRLRPEDVI